ncbi:hypothetical protein [Bacillus sp. REN16]|uniref:hypothetical protein n=1 Tax=Bacillus sp. REN16 TaxID=2887296 RepID=UPI001E5B7345|nr:hypothetical protein [Bacillus sp. REN16]MCC3355767.1 hypothetical protein [Bacillus sp. REN16]
MKDLTFEEFPEGPAGAPRGEETPVQNKSTPWKKGQEYYTPYNYEFKSLHEDLPRQFPGAHHTHDEDD